MDIEWKLSSLEPIQEESEQEDETEGNSTEEREEEDFQIEGVETQEVMVEDESEEEESEEDDVPLRVLRPRRLSRSLSQENSLQNQSANNHQEEKENLSQSDWSMHGVSFGDEATPPRRSSSGSERRLSTSEQLKIMVSRQKHTPNKPSVKRREKMVMKVPVEPLPEWVVNLMFNIEEATTHQLVVE